MSKNENILKDKALSLPLLPGVYIMKDEKKNIIYIGKAKLLKNRVLNYFTNNKAHGIKVMKMLNKVADFDYIITDSEFEALILECNLIKRYKPKYNILLKDDKGYSYIEITKEKWPRINAVKQKKKKEAVYLGPYISAGRVKRSVTEVKQIFKLPTCNKNFDKKQSRPCLNHYISICDAPCCSYISHSEYEENSKKAFNFLKNGAEDTIKELKASMQKASKELDFEKAAVLRDNIRTMEEINGNQKIIVESASSQDIISTFEQEDKICFYIFHFEQNQLFDSDYYIVDVYEDASASMSEFLKSYYSEKHSIPSKIYLEYSCEDTELISKMLSEISSKKVQFYVPIKGEMRKLVLMSKKNAREKLIKHFDRDRQKKILLEMQSQLLLKKIPIYIESYDISHISGTNGVGAMVVFENGIPKKRAYKKFIIKKAKIGDDVAAMAEVTERRFKRYLMPDETDEGFKRLPDLILLDGGTNQLNAVKAVLAKMSIPEIEVFAMIKDDKHRTSVVSNAKKEISLSSKYKFFPFIGRIQEEVHRFAVSYHHNRHEASSNISLLNKIPGIGDTKARKLIKHFKTIENIKKASAEEILLIEGISKKNAEAIFAFFG